MGQTGLAAALTILIVQLMIRLFQLLPHCQLGTPQSGLDWLGRGPLPVPSIQVSSLDTVIAEFFFTTCLTVHVLSQLANGGDKHR